MKKIIALAVASAFVAPAMAADITVGGAMTYNYISNSAGTLSDKVQSDDNAINFTAVQEIDNGWTVTGRMNLVDDTAAGYENQGVSITISMNEMGSLAIGDNGGALDATGDYTDVSPVFGGFDADGGDQALLYTFPSFNGFTLRASTSPSGASYVGSEGGTDADTQGLTEGRDASAISLTYAAGPFAIYYGNETLERAVGQEQETTAAGVRYSANGITVAFETGETENVAASATYANQAANDQLEYRGIALTYQMDKVTLGMERQETTDTTGTNDFKNQDESILFVSYDLGGGVSVYAATKNSDSDYTSAVPAEDDEQAVGINFRF